MDATEAAVGASSRSDLAARSDGVTAKIRHAVQTRIIDTAPEEVSAALVDAPSRDVLVAAEAHARALARSRKSAAKIGLGTATESAISSIRRACVGRIDEVLSQASGSGDPAANKANANAVVFQSVRLIELADGAASARQILANARQRLKALAG